MNFRDSKSSWMEHGLFEVRALANAMFCSVLVCGAVALFAEAQAAKAPAPIEGISSFENLAPPDHALAQQVLSLALQNHYQGNYRADVELVRSSYRDGIERLLGTMQVDETTGSRKLDLKNLAGEGGFTYRSENFGTEQWVQDQKTSRLRRIANRQYKKNALGTDLTYEDLMRLPLDLLRGGEVYPGHKGFKETDQTYQITVALPDHQTTFYSKVEAEVSKSPLRIRSLVLFDKHGKRCKQVDMTGYTEVQGKWLLQGFKVINCDSSASTWVALRNPVLPDLGSMAKADHVHVHQPMPSVLGPGGLMGGYSKSQSQTTFQAPFSVPVNTPLNLSNPGQSMALPGSQVLPQSKEPQLFMPTSGKPRMTPEVGGVQAGVKPAPEPDEAEAETADEAEVETGLEEPIMDE